MTSDVDRVIGAGECGMRTRTTTMMIATSLIALAGAPTMPVASAKDQPPVEARVDKLEHEMRAVQRKVFPARNHAARCHAGACSRHPGNQSNGRSGRPGERA
jgi:hypothetical protein